MYWIYKYVSCYKDVLPFRNVDFWCTTSHFGEKLFKLCGVSAGLSGRSFIFMWVRYRANDANWNIDNLLCLCRSVLPD